MLAFSNFKLSFSLLFLVSLSIILLTGGPFVEAKKKNKHCKLRSRHTSSSVDSTSTTTDDTYPTTTPDSSSTSVDSASTTTDGTYPTSTPDSSTTTDGTYPTTTPDSTSTSVDSASTTTDQSYPTTTPDATSTTTDSYGTHTPVPTGPDGKVLYESDLSKTSPSKVLGTIKKGSKAKLDTCLKVTALDSSNYIEFDFKKGSVGSNGVGAEVVYAGPSTGAADFGEDATLSYTVRFQDGFEWNKGGKLPGLFGGDLTETCSGGTSDGDCFSSRIMWRANGAGEAYIYLPNMKEQVKHYCPKNTKQCTMGISLERGKLQFDCGKDHKISMRVKLNTPNQSDGVLTVSLDGNVVIDHNDIMWRTKDSVKISAVFFNSFFGGSGPEWASPKDQSIYFKDIKVVGA